MFVRCTKALAQSIDLDFSPYFCAYHDPTGLQSDASGGTIKQRVLAGGYSKNVVLLITTDIGLYIDVNYKPSGRLPVVFSCLQWQDTTDPQYQTR